jgi:hypothetical protein
MPKMNGTGPEGHGPATGRRLGKCQEVSRNELLSKLGKGLGKRRKADGSIGNGRRMKSGQSPN